MVFGEGQSVTEKDSLTNVLACVNACMRKKTLKKDPQKAQISQICYFSSMTRL